MTSPLSKFNIVHSNFDLKSNCKSYIQNKVSCKSKSTGIPIVVCPIKQGKSSLGGIRDELNRTPESDNISNENRFSIFQHCNQANKYHYTTGCQVGERYDCEIEEERGSASCAEKAF